MVKETENVRDDRDICRHHVARWKVSVAMVAGYVGLGMKEVEVALLQKVEMNNLALTALQS